MKDMSIRLAAVALLVTVSSGSSPQTPATGNVMRTKLAHSQRILEAIMTSNYKMLDEHSAALVRATQAPGWTVLRTPEYARHSADFVRASENLVGASNERDLDAAVRQYVALTLACYECHRYVARARMTR